MTRALSLFLPFLLLAFVACSDRDEPEASPQVADADESRTTAPANSGDRDTPTARAANSPTAMATVDPGPPSHEGDRTMEHIRVLTEEIGPRVSGTDGEERAVEYISSEFERLGFDIEVMPFEFATGGFQDDSLTVDGDAVQSRRFNGSGTAEVEGEAVYVGLGDDAGIAGKEDDLNGRFALVDRGDLTFSEKFANVKRHGAIGMIVVNNAEGLFAGRIEPKVDEPVVGVGIADGAKLKAAAASGGMFKLSIPKFNGKNVIARPPGTDVCTILVGGHHDSVPGVPGATDNASGTATVLELARAFASDGLDDGLCFATFGGEESGLHGSSALARRLDADGKMPAAYLNLDVTGTGTEVMIIGDRELVQVAVEDAAEQGLAASSSTEPAGTSSDHASFRALGVPVLYFASDDYSTIHTPEDAIGTLDPALVDDIGDLAYTTITRWLQEFVHG